MCPLLQSLKNVWAWAGESAPAFIVPEAMDGEGAIEHHFLWYIEHGYTKRISPPMDQQDCVCPDLFYGLCFSLSLAPQSSVKQKVKESDGLHEPHNN